jgi:hypothetical protein
MMKNIMIIGVILTILMSTNLSVNAVTNSTNNINRPLYTQIKDLFENPFFAPDWYHWMNHSSSLIPLLKRVWIYKDSRPVVTITGSHRNLTLFGGISLKGKQLFRIYERFNKDTF